MLLFSTAIHPPQTSIDEILALRKEIKEVAGGFKRYNTTPHITINVLTPFFLPAWQKHIQQHLSAAIPFSVNFELQYFLNPKDRNTHLVFAPMEENKDQLVTLMKSVNTKSPKALKKVTTPHITIAYALNDKQCNSIKKHFAKRSIQLQFTIDRLTIRRREDDQFAQYQVHSEYIFGKPADGLLF
ncbi:MAG TPA: 2'-5' RNA ligase family protein [Chitinophagales bacterium]|nr:2'-5' RNA ligase family protein [Chitinophagales bacterium]